jgi:hypothetical protein
MRLGKPTAALFCSGSESDEGFAESLTGLNQISPELNAGLTTVTD